MPATKYALEFAEQAARHFKDNPSHTTYTTEEVKAGYLFAVRWNRDTVLVLQIDRDTEPELYSTWSLIESKLPPLVGEEEE